MAKHKLNPAALHNRLINLQEKHSARVLSWCVEWDDRDRSEPIVWVELITEDGRHTVAQTISEFCKYLDDDSIHFIRTTALNMGLNWKPWPDTTSTAKK